MTILHTDEGPWGYVGEPITKGTDMTPDERTRAMAEEAVRRARAYTSLHDVPPTAVALAALKLAAEGWTPPEPVDPVETLFRRKWPKGYTSAGESEALRQFRVAYEAGRTLERETIFAGIKSVKEATEIYVCTAGVTEDGIRTTAPATCLSRRGEGMKPEHIRAEIDELLEEFNEGSPDLEKRLELAFQIQTLQARHLRQTGREYPEPDQ